MNIDFAFYLRLLSRRLPVMLFLFLLVSSIGAVVALRLPPVYEANAKLLVESAQIPDEMVRSTIQINVSEQLAVIEQQLMTRDNLLDIARKNRVFSDQPGISPDEIVATMRAQTNISRSGGRQRANLMNVRFEGQNPNKVAAVVNDYVTIILSSNSDFRTERAIGAMEFFEQEVAGLSNSLDSQSAKILSYKSENADALPENLDFRLQRQSLLQERQARAERDLENLILQRESVERVYNTTGSLQQVSGNNLLTPSQIRLQSLQEELRNARLVYSDENPRIKILLKQVEALETELAGAETSGGETANDQQNPPGVLELTLAELDARGEALKEEVEITEKEINSLQVSINKTPSVRIALEAMERDLRNIQSQYNAAVARLSQAQVGERVELSSKGERITVLEPPSVPNAPARPNRVAIAGMGVVVGSGLAVGFFILLELLNTKIRRPADITNALQIVPLGTIPRFESSASRRKRRRTQIVLLLIVMVAVPTILWAIDTYYLPLEELLDKIITRFF